MDRKDHKKLPEQILNKMASTIYKEIDFVEYIGARTTIVGDSTMENINAVCEFHRTNTPTAARLSKSRKVPLNIGDIFAITLHVLSTKNMVQKV